MKPHTAHDLTTDNAKLAMAAGKAVEALMKAAYPNCRAAAIVLDPGYGCPPLVAVVRGSPADLMSLDPPKDQKNRPIIATFEDVAEDMDCVD